MSTKLKTAGLKPGFILYPNRSDIRAVVRQHGFLVWIESFSSASRKIALAKAAAKISELEAGR